MSQGMPRDLNTLLRPFRGRGDQVITVLQRVQERFGFVPPAWIEPIADALGVWPSRVYGVITFYGQFRLSPLGRITVRVCHGTACHVGGAERIMSVACQELGVVEGETTSDGLFTVEKVFCVGSCSLAPVLRVDGHTYGRMNQAKTKRLVGRLRKQELGAGPGAQTRRGS